MPILTVGVAFDSRADYVAASLREGSDLLMIDSLIVGGSNLNLIICQDVVSVSVLSLGRIVLVSFLVSRGSSI